MVLVMQVGGDKRERRGSEGGDIMRVKGLGLGVIYPNFTTLVPLVLFF